MKTVRLLSILVLAQVLVSCGGSSGSPTAPSTNATTTPTTRIISVDGSLAFGDVVIGQSRELSVTLRNSGTGPITMTGITGSGGVTTVSAATPTTGSIAPGGSLVVTFRFTPTSAGTVSGTITFTTDHTSGTNTTTLTGTGIGAPVTVTGVVTDSNTGRAVGGVRVSALNSAVANVATTTTDGNGFYSFVVPSATALSISYSRDGYNFQSATVTFTGDTRRDIRIIPFWTMSGTGNTVFDMPTYVTRVRVTGRYDSNSSNFIVRVGGRLLVNELLGRAWGSTTYNGLHLTTGGVVEITNSRDVAWTFAQEQ